MTLVTTGGASSAVKYAVIDAASADNTIVAAVTGKKIRVISLFVIASGGENTLRFEAGTGGTALTGQMQVSDNGGFVLGYNEAGWFETTAGALLNLELASATSVDGALSYVQV